MRNENYATGSEILQLIRGRLDNTNIIEKKIFNEKVRTAINTGECFEYAKAGLCNFNGQSWYAISFGKEVVKEQENPPAASLVIIRIFRRSRTKHEMLEKIPKLIKEMEASNCLFLVTRKNKLLSCISKSILCAEVTKKLKNELFKNYEPKIDKEQYLYPKGIATPLADAIVRILLSQP